MNKRSTIIILFLFLIAGTSISKAQQIPQDPFSLMSPYADSLNFYKGLRELQKHKADFEADQMGQDMYLQALATVYAFNGITDSAIFAHDIRYTGGVWKNEPNENTTKIEMEGYKAIDAKQYILNQADAKQIILVNEAHHVPQHRVFVKSLLEDLYHKGYRYLCLEALMYDAGWNAEQNKLTIPFTGSEGYYTKEPCFSELIREAYRLGYVVYGYEPQEQTSSIDERDSLMAVNIHKIFETDPNSKIVALAGYDHINKSRPTSLYSYLKRLYNLDALSVDQTNLYGHSSQYYESPYYVSFLDKFSITTPSVMIDSTGYSKISKFADVMVYSPRVKYLNGRPDWLFEQGKRQEVVVKSSKKTAVIKAYYANESILKKVYSDPYIHVDQVIIDNTASKYHSLILPHGLFLIKEINSEGKILKTYFKQVK